MHFGMDDINDIQQKMYDIVDDDDLNVIMDSFRVECGDQVT